MSRHSSGLSQPARHVLFFETAPRAKYYAVLIRLGHFADRQMSGGRGRERGWDNGMPAGKLGQTINTQYQRPDLKIRLVFFCPEKFRWTSDGRETESLTQFLR